MNIVVVAHGGSEMPALVTSNSTTCIAAACLICALFLYLGAALHWQGGVAHGGASSLQARGVLHTFDATGRLGNKVFQNLAVSLLSQRYDIVARYAMQGDFDALGLQLHSGAGFMRGPPRPLLNADLRMLLEAKSAPLHHTLAILETYQTPWFARHICRAVLPPMRGALLAANPFRERIGRNSDTCVHVRLGHTTADNVGDIDTFLPLPAYLFPSFYAAVGAPSGRVLVATDSPAHPGITALLQRFSAELLTLDAVQTVQFMATCAHLVLSDGTYSWLAGVLAGAMGNATVRYVPRQAVWHGNIHVFPEWERVVVE